MSRLFRMMRVEFRDFAPDDARTILALRREYDDGDYAKPVRDIADRDVVPVANEFVRRARIAVADPERPFPNAAQIVQFADSLDAPSRIIEVVDPDRINPARLR